MRVIGHTGLSVIHFADRVLVFAYRVQIRICELREVARLSGLDTADRFYLVAFRILQDEAELTISQVCACLLRMQLRIAVCIVAVAEFRRDEGIRSVVRYFQRAVALVADHDLDIHYLGVVGHASLSIIHFADRVLVGAYRVQVLIFELGKVARLSGLDAADGFYFIALLILQDEAELTVSQVRACLLRVQLCFACGVVAVREYRRCEGVFSVVLYLQRAVSSVADFDLDFRHLRIVGHAGLSVIHFADRVLVGAYRVQILIFELGEVARLSGLDAVDRLYRVPLLILQDEAELAVSQVRARLHRMQLRFACGVVAVAEFRRREGIFTIVLYLQRAVSGIAHLDLDIHYLRVIGHAGLSVIHFADCVLVGAYRVKILILELREVSRLTSLDAVDRFYFIAILILQDEAKLAVSQICPCLLRTQLRFTCGVVLINKLCLNGYSALPITIVTNLGKSKLTITLIITHFDFCINCRRTIFSILRYTFYDFFIPRKFRNHVDIFFARVA